MKTSRVKRNESDHLASQTSAVILTKRNPKAVLSLSILFLFFLALILSACNSRPFVSPYVAKGQETAFSHETRFTPKDFLLGIDENHPIVQAVNNMTYDVLKDNRLTVRAPIEENGKVVEKEFTFTTPSKIEGKDPHLDYPGKQWLWDSTFHAIILSEKNQKLPKKSCRQWFLISEGTGLFPI